MYEELDDEDDEPDMGVRIAMFIALGTFCYLVWLLLEVFTS